MLPFGVELYQTKHFWRGELIKYLIILGLLAVAMLG